MSTPLYLYNSMSRTKEVFEPIAPPHVGMYVCGPTVYGDAHLGHARPSITFDLLYRWLSHLGYKVRYVRNITDVGHLENDADSGEDKIAKKARLEQLEPMEISQHYTNRYHKNMEALNVLPPTIEPRASGHIPEQQALIAKILEAGYAYETNGSVYFDLPGYARSHDYGKLSGRVMEDLLSNTRNLEGQAEKHSPLDFALWKKASPEHIMNWDSPWSKGFPGWHLECSAMSMKYLGETFDIHGGGMDLLFPHHECEIAQSTAALGKESARYWLHNNMITINGQKMGKSLGNFITLDAFFEGNHPLLEKAYSPMAIRFFILQAHYRSTLDFTNEALQASEKGLQRLMAGIETLGQLKASPTGTISPGDLENLCIQALQDDLNSPVLLAHLFDHLKIIHRVREGLDTITQDLLDTLKRIYHTFVYQILGLVPENKKENNELLDYLIRFVLDARQEAKVNRNFAEADRIRDQLSSLGIEIKDRKDGYDWSIK